MAEYPLSGEIDSVLRDDAPVSKRMLRDFLTRMHTYKVHGAVNERDRTPVERFAETLSVTDFGAKGDGETDNAYAFANIADHVAAQRHPITVFVPAGMYFTSRQWVFSTPQASLIGEGFDRSCIICDDGLKFHYPQPQVRFLSVYPRRQHGNVGILFENTWQGILDEVRVCHFAKCLHLLLSREGQDLIPGNRRGHVVVSQHERHTSWPTRWEMFRDARQAGKTTNEHWGSLVTLTVIRNCHLLTREQGHHCIVLENRLHDSTRAGKYGRFSGEVEGPDEGVFFTGTSIEGGHLMSSRGHCLDIGDGVHATKLTGTYLDIGYIGVRMHYGARSFESYAVSYDGAKKRPPVWLPDTSYKRGEEVTGVGGSYKYVCTLSGTSAHADSNAVTNSSNRGAEVGTDVANNRGKLPVTWKMEDSAPARLGVGGFGVHPSGEHFIDLDFRLENDGKDGIWMFVDLGADARWNGGASAAPGEDWSARFSVQNVGGDTIPQLLRMELVGSDAHGSHIESFTVSLEKYPALAAGNPLVRTMTVRWTDARVAVAHLVLSAKYDAGHFGSFRVRLSGLQLNKGVSPSDYLATDGAVKVAEGAGPQGTGRDITDGSAVWDFIGIADTKFAADAQCIVDGGSRTNITIIGSRSPTDPAVEPQAIPNPPNENGH